MKALFYAPFVCCSHDETDTFNYANQAALNLWEFEWDDFIGMPSTKSADSEDEELEGASAEPERFDPGEAEDDLAGLRGDGISLAARRKIANGLNLAVAYQDETLTSTDTDRGGRGVVVEITLKGDFLRINSN